MLADPTMLSRIQFAFTISFHILYPAFSIGLATFIAIMEGAWLYTKNPKYLGIAKFWIKVFALTFGMGVVSGIVMEFQFGTNWAGFAHKVGPILGALFTYEVLTAFFIEAGFLGVMIFGWNKVGPKLHFLATVLVVIGVTLSAFWIMAANSWMQTPRGVTITDGVISAISWYHVIFNYTVVPRFIHMLLSTYLSTAMVIMAICAAYLIRGVHLDFAKTCIKFSVLAVAILAPLQIVVGDVVGVRVFKYQPIKTAAIEANWNTMKGAPLILFAIPDDNAQMNHLQIGIPGLASFINTHSFNGELPGLKSVAKKDRPPVPVVFFSFRIMVACGMLMLFISWLAAAKLVRGQLYDCKWLLKTMYYAAPVGFIALMTGWFTAEVGRQPWAVYNVLRTSDAVSVIPVSHVITSLVLIVIVYGLIFGLFYFRYLLRILAMGPTAKFMEMLPFTYLEFAAIEAKKEDI